MFTMSPCFRIATPSPSLCEETFNIQSKGRFDRVQKMGYLRAIVVGVDSGPKCIIAIEFANSSGEFTTLTGKQTTTKRSANLIVPD